MVGKYCKGKFQENFSKTGRVSIPTTKKEEKVQKQIVLRILGRGEGGER